MQLLFGHKPHILPVQTQQNLLLLELTASLSLKFAADITEALQPLGNATDSVTSTFLTFFHTNCLLAT